MTTTHEPIDWTSRLHARVEANTHGGELFPGYVVRLYDRQAPDPQAPILDSEHVHGKAGVFATEDEAETYRDRRLAASVADHEVQDAMKAERGPACALLEDERLAQIARWEAERKALGAKVKAATEEIKRLIGEATSPETLVECAPRGEGWVVMAAQSLVDGTLGGAPKILRKAERTERRARLGSKGVLDQALADMDAAGGPAKTTRLPPKRKTKAKPAEDLPPVVDAAGAELAIGSPVELPGLKPVVSGRVVEIGEYDTEAGSWIVVVETTVEGETEILRPLACECVRDQEPGEDESQ